MLAINFQEKLTILMDITKTTNIKLAKYASLDPSYISRLKNGSRNPSPKASYLEAFAQSFSKNIKSASQREMLKNLMQLDGKFPEDMKIRSELIYCWLTRDFNSSSKANPGFIDILPMSNNVEISPYTNITSKIYYGIEGKRAAAYDFFNSILSQSAPQTLLFFSDEDMNWMIGDPQFSQQWLQLMNNIILKGNRIRIIHDVSRDLDEMLSSIQQWIPLYMTGAIEPFYYPRKRDGVYRRSLFIVPGISAVSSSSIGNDNPNDATTFFYTDKPAVTALVNEFQSYLALCRPLMKIFTPQTPMDYLASISEFADIQESTIVKSKHISPIAMPLNLLESILQRSTNPGGKQLQDALEKYLQSFNKIISNNQLSEIFSIPPLADICEGRIEVELPNILTADQYYYTKGEYRSHLQRLLALQKRYPNYHVYIEKNPVYWDWSLYAQENEMVYVTPVNTHQVILAIVESNLATSFWDFIVALKEDRCLSKEDSIAVLEKTIQELA